MATIVEHKDGGRYIALGFGYGTFKSAGQMFSFGTPHPVPEGERAVLGVCDFKGRVGMVSPDDVLVVSVDGKAPGEWIQ